MNTYGDVSSLLVSQIYTTLLLVLQIGRNHSTPFLKGDHLYRSTKQVIVFCRIRIKVLIRWIGST